MPILHSQSGAQTKAPDGTIVQVPGNVALHQLGPRIPIVVTLADEISAQLVNYWLMGLCTSCM